MLLSYLNQLLQTDPFPHGYQPRNTRLSSMQHTTCRYRSSLAPHHALTQHGHIDSVVANESCALRSKSTASTCSMWRRCPSPSRRKPRATHPASEPCVALPREFGSRYGALPRRSATGQMPCVSWREPKPPPMSVPTPRRHPIRHDAYAATTASKTATGRPSPPSSPAPARMVQAVALAYLWPVPLATPPSTTPPLLAGSR